MLLPAGDLELTGFPRELRDQSGWRFQVVSLESDEARCGYPHESGMTMGSVPSRRALHQIPAGLYCVGFWKGDPNRSSSDEELPTATVAHEAYRWVVEVKAGQMTSIDLG